MATAVTALIPKVRRLVRDWPDQDALTGSLSSSTTTVTVADSSIYFPNETIEVEQEAMIVRAKPSATTMTVLRGAYGSTAATHATGLSILRRPAFLAIDILDALNCGLDAMFPWIYKPVLDSSLTAAVETYEYTVPNLPGTSEPIPVVVAIEIKPTGETRFFPKHDWYPARGATPKIVFRRDQPAGTMRVHGFGPFPHLATTASSLDAQFPERAEGALVFYAAQWLLASGEAGRVRADAGQVEDRREAANRVSSSLAASNGFYTRFERMLMSAAMPPMPRHASYVP